MSIWAIGDIQGCYLSFACLLERIDFVPGRDRLWLVGDLVNRGPMSLEVLRWAYTHRDAITVVLGNHDLHLLAIHAGVARLRGGHTITDVLTAPDRVELLDWLRQQPLLHRLDQHLLVHAGIHPSWTFAEAERRARRAEPLLRGDDWPRLLTRDDSDASREIDDARNTIAVLTRIRMVDKRGNPQSDYDGPPESAPRGYFPWYTAHTTGSREGTCIFGHWAALGRRIEPGIIALDSGCVWGNSLTAVRLEDRHVVEQPCIDKLAEGEGHT